MKNANNESKLHRNANGREFERHEPISCYSFSGNQGRALSPQVLSAITQVAESEREVVQQISIPPRDARAFTVPQGAICRIEVTEGSQVADLNMWNAHNPRERFYSAKTRQIHASHLSVGHSLWSNMPYIRPLATMVKDTICYGIDDDNAGVHDVIGSRCDPYTHYLMTNDRFDRTCHSNLTRAILPWSLTESDVHDVFNVFMCTGFKRGSGEYFVKPSPAVKGDHIELFAHMDLLVAISTCPQGDVSIACGSEAIAQCFALGVKVFKLPPEVLAEWKAPSVCKYDGAHGLQARAEAKK